MKKDKKQKIFNLSEETINKLEQLKLYTESKNPGQKIFEKDVIVDAINLAHSAAFGKDVFQEIMTRFENVLRNNFQSILREYAKPFGEVMDSIYEVESLNKEMMLLMLRANKILPNNEQELIKVILDNHDLESKMMQAVHYKNEN